MHEQNRDRAPLARPARGQSLVEFALALPILLLLLLGMVDFSRLLFTYISLANGAREMARVAAVTSVTSDATAINAFNNLTLFMGSVSSATDTVTITAVDSLGTSTSRTCTLPLKVSGVGACTLPSRTSPPISGGYVTVAVSYRFNFNPLFQNRLAGVVDAAFLTPFTTLTTTARAFAE
jgi:Flp pilus assembly protein TadG